MLLVTVVWMINPWSTTGDSLEDVLPKDVLKADRVEVMGMMDTLVFLKQDTLWVDESGNEMDKDAVENLLYAADRFRMKGIVEVDDIVEPDYAVRLSYASGAKELGKFQFVNAKNGAFVYADGSETAFAIEIPGFESLSLRKVFSDRFESYQLRLLVDLLPSEIAYVRVRPLKDDAYFVTQDDESQLRYYNENGDQVEDFDEYSVRMLLTYFNGITYERVLGEEDHVRAESVAGFEVKSKTDESHSFTVFEMYDEQGEVDVYRAAVRYNRGDELLLVKWCSIDLIVAGFAKSVH
jgi:hypothetical protein